MMWKLDRPKPALPSSYFWTWDHSTNWVLDEPFLLTYGCSNRYLKKPETYVEDYRRLTDFAAGLGVKGIVIWGFLRDSHGGVDYAKKVADYAQEKGIAIMPGVGTTAYGGIYYEGKHKYNLETFLEKNPDARLTYIDGQPAKHAACPLYPFFREWLEEGIQWLFREFSIGGANLENGDFIVCYDQRCKEHKKNCPETDPDFFRLQGLSYEPALKCIEPLLSRKLVTWATYSGFVPGSAPEGLKLKSYQVPFMGCDEPAMIKKIPQESIAQWTLTDMVRKEPLPLTAYLDDGVPKQVFDNPYWPKGIKPPGKRNTGFLHHASQWSHISRYDIALSTIKEACLRAYLSGMEGVSIHGEVSSRHIPSALNYLAFSHFIHYPEDSLREFGRKTIGQVLGSENEGERFIEILAHWDSGSLKEDMKKESEKIANDLTLKVACKGQAEYTRYRFWDWLRKMIADIKERYTASFF